MRSLSKVLMSWEDQQKSSWKQVLKYRLACVCMMKRSSQLPHSLSYFWHARLVPKRDLQASGKGQAGLK